MSVAADYERQSPAASRPDQRIPVYLLTGYLGSGKTSLLKAWLTSPELEHAALIINELGEVGLDNKLLASATESASLVANACVCCTGLPGLEEALEELFWARLHKRIPPFPALVIETTGLAEPGPVAQSLASTDLLKERYRLAGVITCLSASTAREVLERHSQARAQLAGADLLVITKTDLISGEMLDALRLQLHHQQSGLRIATSSHASLSGAKMQALLQTRTSETITDAGHDSAAQSHFEHHSHTHSHTHTQHTVHEHGARAQWLALPQPVLESELRREIEALQLRLGPALLRLKGRVQTEQGPRLVQLAPFDPGPEISADPVPRPDGDASSDPDVWGFTLIVASPVSPDVGAAMAAALLKTTVR